MISASKPIRALMFGAAALAMALVVDPAARPAFAASEVSITVNKTVITNGDIARRVAFLRLQHQKGNLKKLAQTQLVDEALKRQEIARMGMSVSTQEVDAAFARFSASNKLSPQQMGKIIDQAGVGVEHFKAYIAVSMSWPRVLNAHGSGGGFSNQDAVTRMLQNKEKPVTTEYFLQQVIFVVPASKKGITGKRKAEAEASRSKYPGCEQAKVFAATMKDVSIRSLGRVLEPELPEDWKPLILKANGMTTGTRVTDRGVEYLAICKKRQVNDDYAAEVVFRAEELGKRKSGSNPREEKYLDDLRSKARIVYH